MSRFTDFQRSKVYRCEHATRDLAFLARRVGDDPLAEAQEVVAGLAKLGYPEPRSMKVRINPNFRGGTAGWARFDGTIELARRPLLATLIHEVSHLVAYRVTDSMAPGHGIEFARIVADAYEVFFPNTRAELLARFDDKGVYYDYAPRDAYTRSRARWMFRHEADSDGTLYAQVITKSGYREDQPGFRLVGRATLSEDDNAVVFSKRGVYRSDDGSLKSEDAAIPLDLIAYIGKQFH